MRTRTGWKWRCCGTAALRRTRACCGCASWRSGVWAWRARRTANGTISILERFVGMLRQLIAAGLVVAAPLHAQTGAATAPPTVQPAAGGQVGRPPQNSAMRQAGAGGAASAQAQAGAGSTPTNAMTLTLGGGLGSQSQSGTSQRNQGGMNRGGSGGQQGAKSQGAGDAAGSGQQGPAYGATGILRSRGNAASGSPSEN